MFTETPPKAEKQKAMLICPKCGAAHTLTAKFCRNDGTLLKEAFSKKEEPVHTREEMKADKTSDASENKQDIEKHFKAWRWASALATILLLAGIGIYLYFSANKGLKADGQIYPIDSTVQNQNSGDLLQSSSNIKKPSIDASILEIEINRALRKKGIYRIYVEVDTDLVASLTGNFVTRKDREMALDIIASYEELRVRDMTSGHPSTPQVNIAKLGGQINNALREAGIKGVVVEVDDASQVTLKGAVKSVEEKNRAFEIARLFKEAKKVKDLIFIVES